MTPLTIGFLGIGVLLVLLALRVPIAVALGGVSLVGIGMVRGMDAVFGAARSMPYTFIAKWELSAVPMFLLMGAIAYHSGLTAGIFHAMRLWLSRLPGGLAVATNFASAGFAAASGSSMATAASMGRLAIPEMLRYRYDPGLATGVVAASGTLGSLIPPSVLLIIFGMMTETSIGKLFIAGVLPGILTAVVYAAMIIGRCVANPALAPTVREDLTWGQRFRALLGVWQLPVLVAIVIVSIYGGYATTTEAAAVGAMAAFLMAAFKGALNLGMIRESVWEALRSTATVLFISLGAILFSRFLTFCGLPQYMAGLARGLEVSPILLMMFIAFVYLVLGMFLDPIGLMLLTVPIFLPFFTAAGFDKIWMGIMVIKFIEIGLITPPVGLNAFVVKGVVGDRVALGTIFRGLGWFIVAEVLVVLLLVIFPQIVMVLPNRM
ncbi:TRAP transporter, DctM subunit [Gemmobacter megaterium]|uniref:TRAP transporter large permease protein n=1 Tax=Gemmobacter megaterium TaxID=1086013 RepID=A0A1N7LMK8_9RHOB|nr:TRAP transporter large permease [Gemmobacter megaterium]GGE11716.1 C4-dicarboxylate ABC transporter [Gemmobacter megaterium]SIS75047.1 TRAP transporter, DctM subunit [Gemmobacter megaterium]